MSRIAKKPLTVPKGVEFNQNGRDVHIKGEKGAFKLSLDEAVTLQVEGNVISVRATAGVHPMIGTTCKLLSNMMTGVSKGFERKLTLVGVGYRAKIEGDILELSLGFSNPVRFPIPASISIKVPTNTEIIVSGIDKQIVGETAAKIRKFRPPECYKGKGVRYFGEVVKIKETKKK
ncbi:MAG: 50S ribosomal protein L6 [Gammaproteobacteria bacterium]|jgi:large subunit ribosomal protein L6|nr:50S ribosomal protein L6 [Gammaproteobacteria bacterium]